MRRDGWELQVVEDRQAPDWVLYETGGVVGEDWLSSKVLDCLSLAGQPRLTFSHKISL
jgi:hypothetical protein